MSFGHSWGGAVNSTAMFTSDLPYIYYPSVPMPAGRVAANGNAPIRIDSCSLAYVTNGSVSMNYQGSSAVGTVFATSGGGATVYANRIGGTMTVGRETGGSGRTYWSDGDSLAGAMPGSLGYSTVPSAPLALALNGSLPGRIRLTWSPPSDNGQQAITGYRLQRADNAAFTVGVTNFDLGVVLTYDDTTATPGKPYFYRVFAKNLVSTAAGTYSVASGTVTGGWVAGLQYDNGTAFVYPLWFYDNGTDWLPITEWWYDTGTDWVLAA